MYSNKFEHWTYTDIELDFIMIVGFGSGKHLHLKYFKIRNSKQEIMVGLFRSV